MNISVTNSPTKEELATLSKGIGLFNQDYLPDEVGFEKDTKFAVIAKDNKGKIIGGIRATAFWNYCIIPIPISFFPLSEV
jgi:hypothetical protein